MPSELISVTVALEALGFKKNTALPAIVGTLGRSESEARLIAVICPLPFNEVYLVL